MHLTQMHDALKSENHHLRVWEGISRPRLQDVYSDPMPKDLELRLNNAEEKLNRHAERIATLEGRLTPIPEHKPAITLARVSVTAFVAVTIAFCGWLGTSMVGVREDIASIKANIGLLQKAQAANTLDSAEQQAKAGKAEIATERVKQTVELLRNLSDQRVPAPSGFFEETFQKLHDLGSAGLNPGIVNDATTELAQYRSALQPIPQTPGKIVNISSQMNLDQIADQLQKAGVGSFKAARPDVQFFGHPPGQEDGTIQGGILIGERHKLLGDSFLRSTFIKNRIFYLGTLPSHL